MLFGTPCLFHLSADNVSGLSFSSLAFLSSFSFFLSFSSYPLSCLSFLSSFSPSFPCFCLCCCRFPFQPICTHDCGLVTLNSYGVFLFSNTAQLQIPPHAEQTHTHTHNIPRTSMYAHSKEGMLALKCSCSSSGLCCCIQPLQATGRLHIEVHQSVGHGRRCEDSYG